jgi:CheY-like chemotaxis protein
MNSILIVEDDEDVRDSLSERVRGDGYHVFSAGNGLDGLSTLRFIKPPALIILDQRMPLMSGAEFLQIKSREKAWASIPVIVVSSDALEVSSPDVVDYIPKPLQLDRLLAAIRKIVPWAS